MASKTIKVKASILHPDRNPVGETVFHFGHKCTVEKGGVLVCDMDEDLARNELEAGRFMEYKEPEETPAKESKKEKKQTQDDQP